MKNLIFIFTLIGVFALGANVALAAPTISSNTASNITQTSADLNGSVNPNGASTLVWYETPSGGPFQSQNIGNGIVDVNLMPYTLSGLTPNTNYTFRIVASDGANTTNGSWIAFTTLPAPPAPSVVSANASNITTTSADLNGSVNPNGSSTLVWYETPSGGPFQSQNIGSGVIDVNLMPYTLAGLTPNTNYSFRVVASSVNGVTNGSWIAFTTLPAPPSPAPTIVSATASGITATSANLNGSVNPNGSSTLVWYETPTGGPFQSQNIGSGSSAVVLMPYTLAGLTPNTNYTFRVVASNANGVTNGSWIAFTTLALPPNPAPTIVSATATNITTTSADLNGSVNPNGFSTLAWYETPSGGPFQSQNIGSGAAPVALMPYTLAGLTPNTNYTFRVVASNANGVTTGSWIAFTTLASPSTPTLTLLAPNSGTQGQTLNVNLTGTGFIAGTTASFVNPGIAINSTLINNPTSITLNITIAPAATVGGGNVTVTNANGTSGAQVFTVNASGGGGGGGGGCGSLPTVSSLIPSSVLAGSGATVITINGNNFIASSSAIFGGNPKTTTFISATQLTMNLLASDVVAAGSASLSVGNGSGCNSSAITFTISPVFGSPVVVTANASNVLTNGATLNGSINPNGQATTAWFEYGTSDTLATSTETAHLNQGSSITAGALVQNISSLIPNTVYYFRAVASNSSGTAKGNIFSFKTALAPIVITDPTPPITTTQGPTTSTNTADQPIVDETDNSNSANAELQITNTAEKLAIGDAINYSISVKNLVDKNLANIKIIVQLPKEVDFMYSELGLMGDNNTVIFDIGTLFPDEIRSMAIEGKVNSSAEENGVLVTTAVMSYNVAGSSQNKDETAYVINSIGAASSTGLEANPLFGFIPRSLSWPVLIIIILGLALLARKLLYKKA